MSAEQSSSEYDANLGPQGHPKPRHAVAPIGHPRPRHLAAESAEVAGRHRHAEFAGRHAAVPEPPRKHYRPAHTSPAFTGSPAIPLRLEPVHAGPGHPRPGPAESLAGVEVAKLPPRLPARERGKPPRRGRFRNALAAAACAALFITGLVELSISQGPSADASGPTTTVNLTAAADTYVTSAAPNVNFGTADQIQATDQPGHHKLSFIRFQLPALANQSVVSAQLVLTRTNHHPSGLLQVQRVADNNWNERTLTFRNAPPVQGVLSAAQTAPAMQTVTLAIRPGAIAGSQVTLALTSPATTNFVAFRSRQWGVGGPVLRLTLQNGGASTQGASTPTSSSSSPSSAGSSTTSSRPPSSSASSAPPSTTAGSTSAAPSTSAPGGGGGGSGGPCTVSAKLVPSCGFWWGIAPKAHTSTPRPTALAEDEQEAQTHFTLMHTYHVNGDLFPTAAERDMAFQTGGNRILLINWKPATDMTWAAVANGAADARIDKEAAYINSTFPYPFFLAIWHEPENDLNQTPGSGMTASDYAAMFRHVVLRLRADGATKPVIVMDYMGFDNYAKESWFSQLWPGDDVVDWIGIDPYGSGESGVYQSGDFSKLVNRAIPGFPGYYTWATTTHPGKPIMLAEWGVNEGTNDPGGKAAYFDSVSTELKNFPDIKALVYFDEDIPNSTEAGTTTSPDTSPESLAAFRRLCAWAASIGPKPMYSNDNVEAST